MLLSIRCVTVVGIGLLTLVAWLPSNAADAPLDYDKLVTEVGAMNAKLENLRGEIDQTRFDSDAWLDALDYDAETIIEAVRDQVAFEPYAGVLRGPTGTLRARAGNAIDQALLLASLLKSAGFDARIVQGDLVDADARRLLLSLSADQEGADQDAQSLDYLSDVMKREFGPEAIAVDADVDWKTSNLALRTQQTSKVLSDALAAAGIRLKPQNVTATLIEEARAYFWVQYREGASGPWEDVHPAFAGAAAPGVSPSEFFAEKIPDKHAHLLTISAWMSQDRAGKLETRRLMADFTRPVANLDGVAITYQNRPSGLNTKSIGDIGGALADTKFLVPTFNGAIAPGGSVFDLNGNTVDPMAMQGGAAGLFATLADKSEGAIGGLTGKEDVVSLQSMWLEFAFTAPDGGEFRTRRYLITPDVKKEKLWPLITEHIYVVNSGRLPIDYLAERYLAAGIEGSNYFKALAHKFIHPDAGTPVPKGNVPSDFGPLSQYRFMDAYPLAAGDLHPVRAQPSLLGIRRGYRDATTAFVGVDVVANATAQFKVAGGEIIHDGGEALRRGVWDTSVESAPAQSLGLDVHRRANAFEVVNAALAQDIALKVLRPGAGDKVAELGLTSGAAAILRETLDAGYAVVIPETTPQGLTMTGWWRVHPETGETLGMTADGYGAEIVEYLIDMVNTAFSLVQAVGSLKACEAEQAMDRKLCCLVEAHVNNVAGLGFGGGLGALVGSSGAALFTIVDYGTSLATEAMAGPGQGVGLMPKVAAGCDRLPATDW